MPENDKNVRVLISGEQELELRALIETAINSLGARWLEARKEPLLNQGTDKATGWTTSKRCETLADLRSGEMLDSAVRRARVLAGYKDKGGCGCKSFDVPYSVLNRAHGFLKSEMYKKVKKGTHSPAQFDCEWDVVHLLTVALVSVDFCDWLEEG